MANKNLPALTDLYNDKITLSQQNDLNQILNGEPKREWLKEHPIAKVEITENGQKKKVPVKYIPIERTEWLLTNIYVQWRIELLREGLIANSVYVAVRLHYRNPITGEWEYQDGLGAQPLQTDSGAGATDWQKVKANAVQIALPAAESYAVKDAAEKLGKLFGKDLNRADKIGYDTLAGKFEEKPDFQVLLKEAIDIKDKLLGKDKQHYHAIIEARSKSGELNVELLQSLIPEMRAKLPKDKQ
jgi:hypothetical protein